MQLLTYSAEGTSGILGEILADSLEWTLSVAPQGFSGRDKGGQSGIFGGNLRVLADT